jgi:hypothetical protein
MVETVTLEEFEKLQAEQSPRYRYHGAELDAMSYGQIGKWDCTWNHCIAKTNQEICQGKSYMYRHSNKRGYKVSMFCRDKIIYVMKKELK